MVAPQRPDTGTRVPVSPPTAETANVLTDVVLRRHRQIRLWGHNEDTPDGTGPRSYWLLTDVDELGLQPAAEIEWRLRQQYEAYAQAGNPLTWMHFLREEVAEAFKEDDPAKLYDELIDVAAVAVSWAEKIRTRS